MEKEPCVRIVFPDDRPAFELVGYNLARIPDIAIGECAVSPYTVNVCTADSQAAWRWERDMDHHFQMVRLAAVWWLCSEGLDQEFNVTSDEYEAMEYLAWPRLEPRQEEASNAL